MKARLLDGHFRALEVLSAQGFAIHGRKQQVNEERGGLLSARNGGTGSTEEKPGLSTTT
jgi:hypothetical protein